MSQRTALLWIMVGVVFLAAIPAAAVEEDATPRAVVREWLLLGPVLEPLPVFADEEAREEALKALLAARPLPPEFDRLLTGEKLKWLGREVSWRPVEGGADGAVELSAPESVDGKRTAVAWFSTRLHTDRFLTVALEVESEHPTEVIIDGRAVGEDDTDLSLDPGSHRLVVVTAYDRDVEAPWAVTVGLEGEEVQSVGMSDDGERDLAILDILDQTTVTGLDLSPEGDRVLLTLARVHPGTDDRETWVELRATDDGRLLNTWRGSPAMSQVEFAPIGNRISYVTRNPEEKTSNLWIADIETGSTRAVAEGVENWGGYQWSPSGETIVFSATEKPEKDERGIKRLRGLLDRMAGHRDISSLYLVRVADGVARRLTTGPVSANARAFSPDGTRLLVSREVEDYSQRPYSRTELWELDLFEGGAIKLRDFWWLYQVEYAPDGRRLLVRAGPSDFGNAGIAEGVGEPVNDYDSQLFIWDPESDAVEAVTRGFDPAVVNAAWSRHDGAVYILTVDGEEQNIYRYHPEANEFHRLTTGIESVGAFDVARRAATVVAAGTSVWGPQRVVILDELTASPRLLFEPAAERFRTVRRSAVEPWNFTASDGRTVVGRVYLPVGFDAKTRYPAIVNYYGGTSPIGRSFGGRYPAEWWAANGYVVYVLNPTGAYGWGQAESAVHVNDWGEVTSRQIIDATTAFLHSHPYVDPERVGCIGASYGGFMTMKLVTETDIFAAAVAHAGISALSSYWGEGYWGYSYGAVANADSFPWNRKDIFVERSPLFHADAVTTPILLTHGDDDPNVPSGESDQFFAALKLLGTPVEYLRVAGLGHLIMEHDKRELWSRSIVAWFDFWLKDQPEWWEALYPTD
jgi:dipeptidyl aminopeptidase/acylaminoacyl peptidase